MTIKVLTIVPAALLVFQFVSLETSTIPPVLTFPTLSDQVLPVNREYIDASATDPQLDFFLAAKQARYLKTA